MLQALFPSLRGSTSPSRSASCSRGHGISNGVICPSGGLLTAVSIPLLQKYFASPVGQIISTSLRHPTPQEGRIMIVTKRGVGCGGRGSVLRAMDCRAGRKICERSTARGREMLQRTAKSCGPDAPTLASSSRMLCRPNRVQMQCKFANDGGKRARSPRRARRKPLKPLRAGMPGDSGVLVVTRVRLPLSLHTRPRVQRASGVPHALFGRKIKATPRAHRVAGVKAYPKP